MSRGLHWSLNSLPPNLREQAERKLGLQDVVQTKLPVASNTSSCRQVFVVPNSTPPDGHKQPRRRRGGVIKANSLSDSENPSEAVLGQFPDGFKSIVQEREEKKAKKKRVTLTPDMAPKLVKSCQVSPDGDEVRFVLGCSPYMIPTAQEKKIAMIGNRPRLYKAPKVQKAEKTITMAMEPFAHHFKDWINCPIGVWIDFCYEYPSGIPKKDLIEFRYSLQKNDLDNSEKGLQDALTHAGFWDDDNKIASLNLRKFRVVTEPRIVITIRKLSAIECSSDLFSQKKDFFFKDITTENSSTKKEQE